MILLKNETDAFYIKGIFSSLIILFILAFLTVFPNLWDNFAFSLNSAFFKAVPFFIIAIALLVIFCLSQGISFLFYTGRKREEYGFFSSFHYFKPKRLFYLLRFYIKLNSIKLILFVMAFFPAVLIFFCAFMFYKNACPLLSVGIMSAGAVAALIISALFYAEINSLLFLSSYLFFEDETCRVRDIIKESYLRMKGKGHKIRNIRQSFFLPLLSCIFLIPIPFVLTNYKYALSKKAYELMKK